MKLLHTLYFRYLHTRPFTDHDAWELFRLAAFGEAVGWTLLIIGILCEKLPFSGNQYPVHFFGFVHGMLFFGYIFVVLLASPSMGWRGPRIILAGLCSVPPYGTLVLEKWAEHQRLTRLTRTVQYRLLLQD